MDGFITWEQLSTYTSFVTIVYMIVKFTKDLKFINKIPTQYWSFFVAFILYTITTVATNQFKWADIILYLVSSMSISVGSNGLNDLNSTTENTEKTKEE